jgi:hypothetical protein
MAVSWATSSVVAPAELASAEVSGGDDIEQTEAVVDDEDLGIGCVFGLDQGAGIGGEQAGLAGSGVAGDEQVGF